MRKKIIAGNWKMNGTLSSVKDLLAGIKDGARNNITKAQIVVCPTAIFVQEASHMTKNSNIILGAQDLSDAESGAYTGEVSGAMLKGYDCKYVIVGHSERRNIRGESDELIAAKFAQAQQQGLLPILCVGELIEEREAGTTDEVVARQLDAVINLCGVGALAKAVIAYEPVWAIGTGKTASPEQAQAVHATIRAKIASLDTGVADGVQIQYGGSMNAANAKELLSMPDIDGGLIGGASLKVADFMAICQAAEDLS